MNVVAQKERCYKGVPISIGITIGHPFLFYFSDDNYLEFSVAPSEIENEIQRYRKALELSKSQVIQLQKQLEADGAHEGVLILETHLQIMNDELITVGMEETIRAQKKNAEYLFQLFIRSYEQKLSKLSEEMFREKIRDIQDIAARILKNLSQSVKLSVADLPKNAIVFANHLVPSDAAEAQKNHIGAFVTKVGGKTSHAAIIARSRGIPYISKLDIESLGLSREDLIIVDGHAGVLIVNPTQETLSKYKSIQRKVFSYLNGLQSAGELIAETPDGYRLKLTANIEDVSEIPLVHKYRGDGVGLFRSEYICLSQKKFPTEQEQFEIYKQLVEATNGLPIVIRTFDVGGDKFGDFLKIQEANPFLGCRAIRYMLQNPAIFRAQLRAILRTSIYGQVKVMFPMISGVYELLETKRILHEEMEKLKIEGIEFDPAISIGCMIEIPSAAIICEELAKHCDFFSIGTNDLVQYSLAVDRGNQMMSYLYNPADPSVIRLIKMIVDAANRNGIQVSLCGEMAADPHFTALLLGLGVHELSCTARYIPLVKSAIRKTSIISACNLAEEVLEMCSHLEIQKKLKQEYLKFIPDEMS